MNKLKTITVMSLFLTGAAWAQSDMGTQTSMTRVDDYDVTLKDEVVGIIPQVGVVGFLDSTSTRQSRGVAGLGFDYNVAPLLGDRGGKDYFLGLSTGAFYSHMGATDANFFGATNNQAGGAGANLLVIPADLKVGYNFTPSFRGSLHGGGNITYRSAANAANTGDTRSSDSLWRLYPNAGADLELQVGKHVSLIARPDVTFTSGPTVLMGTLGATFIPSI